MENKKVWFLNKRNKWTSLKIGDIVFGHTGLKEDIYQATDSQVISGKRKIGDQKKRPGLCLDIFNQKEIAVIWASHSGKKPFLPKTKRVILNTNFDQTLFNLLI